jgi:hypothetical protein
VAAVAKWLVGAQAAGTPEVAFAGFQLDGIRAFLSDLRFRHGEFSSVDDRKIIAEVSETSGRFEGASTVGFDGARNSIRGKEAVDGTGSNMGG